MAPSQHGTIGLLIGLACVFVAILLMLLALGLWSRTPTGVSRSLEAVRAMQSAPRSQVQTEVEPPFRTRVGQPLLRRLAMIGRRLDPTGQVNRLRRRLDLAGNPGGWDVDRFLAFKTVGLVVGLVLGLAIGLASGWSLGPLLAVVLGVTALGWFVPDLVLYQVSYDRTERMR